MANETLYKLNSSIAVRYQAPNCATGLTPVMEIYDEAGVKSSDFPDVNMVEIGATGRYVGTFAPDAKGEWLVMINDGAGGGKVVKSFSVGDYSLQDVGDAVVNLDADVVAAKAVIDSTASAVTDLDGDVVAAKAVIDSTASAVTDLDGDVVAAKAVIDSTASAVTNLDGDVVAAKVVIDSTASAVTNLDGDVVAVAGQVTDLDGDVAAVKAVVDGLKTDIDGLEIASPPMVC
jgi:hypothetical protein